MKTVTATLAIITSLALAAAATDNVHNHTRQVYAETIDTPAFTRVDVWVTRDGATTMYRDEFTVSGTKEVMNGQSSPLATTLCTEAGVPYVSLLSVPEHGLVFALRVLKSMPDVVNVQWIAYDVNGNSVSYGNEGWDKSMGGWSKSDVFIFPSPRVPVAPVLPAECVATP